MEKRKSFAGRVSRKILVWLCIIMLGLAFFIFSFTDQVTRHHYSESFHNRTLINREYTRRVLSDVYVAVTNNIYYIEQNLDNPDSHLEVMKRIVKNGTRVRSCGISFIEGYYPEKGPSFCPYAWRNPTRPDVIWSDNIINTNNDYLNDKWFTDVINTDSAVWAEPFFDSHDVKTPLTAYMAPIHDKTGRPVAVIGADVSLDWLTDKVNETDSTINKDASLASDLLGLRSKSYILNHDGTFITHQEEERILKDNFFSHIESYDGSDVEGMLQKMKEGKDSEQESAEVFLYDDQKCYVFYTPVKYTRWTIVTVVPWKSIDILGIINGVMLLLILIIAMLIIVAVTHFYIKRETESLKKLVALTDDMAKGKYDSPMPDIETEDEVGLLRDSLENLQYSLSAKSSSR